MNPLWLFQILYGNKFKVYYKKDEFVKKEVPPTFSFGYIQ